MQVLPSGPRAVLVECDDLDQALALHRLLWERHRPDGLVDAVPGARTLLLVAASPRHLPGLRSALQDAGPRLVGGPAPDRAVPGLEGLQPQEPGGEGPAEVEVPVRYDGPDLLDVAGHTGLTPEEVVTAHTGTPWTVGFGGFAPGFAYLAGGDPRLEVPRRGEPRPRVPAGAVGLAGPFSGIYPRSSPGGWQLIGHTDVVLWDLAADPPALLRPGMRVRFVDTGRSAGPASPRPTARSRHPTVPAEAALPTAAAGVATSAHAGLARRPHLEVLATGPLALLQDAGRAGHAGVGVGPSGAADRGAHALGARLLGQDADTAAVEVHAGGLEVRAHGGVTLVLTGALAAATVDGTPVGHAAPFHLADGSVLRVPAPERGLRTYVSVRGGFDVPAVLGSRSTDTLSGLGPGPLTPGSRLPVGRHARHPGVDVAPHPPLPQGTLVLDIVPGPRTDWLADPGALVRGEWTVGSASDRVGVRLAGEALRRPASREGRELPSEGVVRGAVQVPVDGQPVVFLADHPVTGGYPVVAVLTEPAQDSLAQAVPGQQVRLRWSRA
ncbi:5-oxoprolinase/urea amidolyase family protein [Pedococcus sp. NPDC057267]|uniref:5-oxoprolinase subunit B/C family protein n=1 Tax=Pedococcus sp. NPDC057267 TaxID=3346077 RepID=UPI0036430E7B